MQCLHKIETISRQVKITSEKKKVGIFSSETNNILKKGRDEKALEANLILKDILRSFFFIFYKKAWILILIVEGFHKKEDT